VYRIAQPKGKTGRVANSHRAAWNPFVKLIWGELERNPYSVRYNQVNPMLLNEFLKEHRKNEEQEATIARQQKQIEAIAAGLQKVSAQLEANKSTPQVVAK
jgi:hypothetical protein